MNIPIPAHLRELASRDAVAQYLGVELMALDTGYAMVRMEVQDRHRNLFGVVHGGVIFTLADIAFGLAGNVAGIPSVAIEATISYMKSVRTGTLSAEAREYSSHDRIALYRVVVSGQNDEPIALLHGTAYRKSALPHRSAI
jgi:acyl-CoA thioesterase